MPNSLTKKQARVVEMLIQGMSHKDIAHVLGISRVAVAQHVIRAKARLGKATTTELLIEWRCRICKQQ